MCGCCVDDGTGAGGECPDVTGVCDDPEWECDTGGEGGGVYMCVKRGNSGRESTQVC